MTLNDKATIIDFGLAKYLEIKLTQRESNLVQAMHIAQLLEPYANDNTLWKKHAEGHKFKSTLRARFDTLMQDYESFLSDHDQNNTQQYIVSEINNTFPKSHVLILLLLLRLRLASRFHCCAVSLRFRACKSQRMLAAADPSSESHVYSPVGVPWQI